MFDSEPMFLCQCNLMKAFLKMYNQQGCQIFKTGVPDFTARVPEYRHNAENIVLFDLES